jgi:hypothetical protein
MSRIGNLRDRLLLALLSMTLVTVQQLSGQHAVGHARWATSPASWAGVVTAAAGVPTAGIGVQSGKRTDDGGHLSGDAVCLAITHLLLSPPPASARVSVGNLVGSEDVGGNIARPPQAPSRHSPLAARAPPRSIG